MGWRKIKWEMTLPKDFQVGFIYYPVGASLSPQYLPTP
jgi:hypothetical protein